MNMNGKRDDAIGRVKPSPLFSNSSGSSRIFLHAIDDTYKSKFTVTDKGHDVNISDNVNQADLNKQFEFVNQILNENIPCGGAAKAKNLVTKTPSCECESKVTGLDIHLNDTTNQLDTKIDRTFNGHHKLIMQNVAVNKMMSKKLEQLGHETKGNLCALQKKCHAFEMENKELKENLKSVSERMDRDNEINKRQIEKLTNNILMVLKVANNLTKEQRKIEIDNQQLNARLEQICEVIGIDSAGCSNNDTSND